MQIHKTDIPGAFVVVPEFIGDARGAFFESVRTDELSRLAGTEFQSRQLNYSVSKKNVIRGIHSVTIPPGQAKYVTCVRGELRDFLIDLRIGSPTFGHHIENILDAEGGRGLYIPPGVGHGFLTLRHDTCICYALSNEYVPGTQIDINPLDPDIALPWGFTEPPLISAKDANAPSLLETIAARRLSSWTD
ncbi:dTDP-4-dehydrorhamnose 3,5-epimerase family protein [Rhodococcoides yunnanense]|uniref:dTDP-4-dehydrorhamnose 3,5-epimerase family protein n=1 Tax=Rhodococcoides yunnanense TaxID=278209 RepID=UPI0035300C9B